VTLASMKANTFFQNCWQIFFSSRILCRYQHSDQNRSYPN